MYVLILVDDRASIQPPEHDGLWEPGARRFVTRVLPRIDPQRLQIKIMAMREDMNARAAFDPFALRRLIDFVRDQHVELIHALTPTTAFYAAIVGRVTDIPTLYSVYSVPQTYNYTSPAYFAKRLANLTLSTGIDHVIASSELTKQNLWRINYPQTRATVIYPGAELAPAPVLPDPALRHSLGFSDAPIILVAAHLEENNGLDVLLDMIPRLMSRTHDINVAVIGSGSLLLSLQQQSRRLPIRWLGEHVDVRQLIAISDVITIHPRLETFPVFLIEAQAQGKPIVSSRVLGVTELVEHTVNGLLVTYGDSRDWAIQVGRLLTQPPFIAHLGEVSYERAVQRFSLEVEQDAITTFYEFTIYSRR